MVQGIQQIFNLLSIIHIYKYNQILFVKTVKCQPRVAVIYLDSAFSTVGIIFDNSFREILGLGMGPFTYDISHLFWRTIYQVPKGTPKVMLRTQSTSMKMKQRIWKMKLLMARKILSQERTLAKEIYRTAEE